MANLGHTVSAFLLVTCVVAQPASAQDVNPDAKLMQDYQQRIKAYMDLHKQARKDVPSLKETEDPAKIKATQDALAARVRQLRPKARQGEIFTPEIAALLRRLIYPETKGKDGAATKETLKEDAPAKATVSLKVNARYPDEQPLPTMPPNLLASLPKLPEELEYRIVGKDLILRDVPANLIVDYFVGSIK